MKSSSEIIDAVNKFSGGKLKERNALEFLIRVAIENDIMDLIDEVAFHSKFLWRLFSFFQSGRKINEIDEDLYKSRIFNEITRSVEKIKDVLLKIVSKTSQEDREAFINEFLKMDAESFENFMNLVHDFYWLKNWKIDNEV